MNNEFMGSYFVLFIEEAKIIITIKYFPLKRISAFYLDFQEKKMDLNLNQEEFIIADYKHFKIDFQQIITSFIK